MDVPAEVIHRAELDLGTVSLVWLSCPPGPGVVE